MKPHRARGGGQTVERRAVQADGQAAAEVAAETDGQANDSAVAVAPDRRRDRRELFVALVVILALFGVTGYVNAKPLGVAEDDLDALFAEVWDPRDQDTAAASDASALLDLVNSALDDSQVPAGSGPAGQLGTDSTVGGAPGQVPAAADGSTQLDGANDPGAGSGDPAGGSSQQGDFGTDGGSANAPRSSTAASSTDGGSGSANGRPPASGSSDGDSSGRPAPPGSRDPNAGTLEQTATPAADVTPGPTHTPTAAATLPLVFAPPPGSQTTATAIPDPTSTRRPTRTPEPTETPEPDATRTPTPHPTETPEPSATPIPTETPLPTATPTPGSPPQDPACSTVVGVCVTGAIWPIRLLVVDDQDRLLEVWSNTDAPAEFHVRRGSVTGPDVPLTPQIEANYWKIAGSIPPGARGLVYRR